MRKFADIEEAEEELKGKRLLQDIQVSEISLVRVPATRSQSHGGKFFILKSDGPDKDAIDQLQTLIQNSMKGHAVDENDEETKAILDKLPSPEIKEKFLSACAELKRCSDDMSEELVAAIIDVAELEGGHFGISAGAGYGYPAKKSVIKSALRMKWPSLCTGFSKSELLDMIDDENVKAEIELEEEVKAERVRKTGMDPDGPEALGYKPVEHTDPERRKYEERIEKNSGKILWPSLCSQD
jgi:hypothetical protein